MENVSSKSLTPQRLLNIATALTLTAYWTVESLFVSVGEIRVFLYECFDEVMLLFVLHVVFVCLEETGLTDPLTKPPNLPAITTPVDTTVDFDC